MTRIVSGFAGSLSLEVPRSGTRPTSDRVREAMFSALDARGVLAGARVLDLYAGSGALGLEAASRGAAAVTLVERDRAAAAIARRNAELVLRSAPADPRPRIEVATQAVAGWLAAATGSAWDLVFVDPPYELGESELAAVVSGIAAVLAPGGDLILERSARSPEPTLPAELGLERTKRYGETAVHWITRR